MDFTNRDKYVKIVLKSNMRLSAKRGDDKMRKNEVSVSDVIKAVVLIFIIGNVLFGVVMLAAGETDYIKEVVLKTGVSAVLAVVILLITSALEFTQMKRRSKRSGDIFDENFDDGTEFCLLKCSGGYFQLPVAVIFIDIMVAVMFWREFGTDYKQLTVIIHDSAMFSPLLTLCFFNICAVTVSLYYCCYSVCYTKHGIYMVHFLRKVNISCWEIKEIYYCCKNPGKRKLIIKTEREKLVLRSDVLTDGWNEFCKYIAQISAKRNIPIKSIEM